jgi:MoaA/NifB/PqqE/SkfB family radical SAM enzyme
MKLQALMRDLRFAAGVAGERPFQVLVQVTNRCNMKCSFCDFWPNGAPPSEELTVAEYRRVADELAEVGTFLVSIEGGEPFLRPDILEIVAAFGRRHLPLVYTNGWFIDRARARALYDGGAAHVGVSIDYPDAARHDAKRGLRGTFSRALAAVEHLRDAAPDPLRAHVMSVLMRDNQDDLPELLELSKNLGVGHCVTLLSTKGFRRGENTVDQPPDAAHLALLPELWERYPHFRVFREYLELMEPFALGLPMPTCRAGAQSVNLDHLGNVAPCIEKIDRVVGNVRREPIGAILARMKNLDEVARCQDCWTLCRGVSQALGGRGHLASWRDLATRMR